MEQVMTDLKARGLVTKPPTTGIYPYRRPSASTSHWVVEYPDAVVSLDTSGASYFMHGRFHADWLRQGGCEKVGPPIAPVEFTKDGVAYQKTVLSVMTQGSRGLELGPR